MDQVYYTMTYFFQLFHREIIFLNFLDSIGLKGPVICLFLSHVEGNSQKKTSMKKASVFLKNLVLGVLENLFRIPLGGF